MPRVGRTRLSRLPSTSNLPCSQQLPTSSPAPQPSAVLRRLVPGHARLLPVSRRTPPLCLRRLGQAKKSGAPESDREPPEAARQLAKRLLKLHACGGRCRDAMLAAAVCEAEGPFPPADAERLLADAPPECPLLDGDAWRLLVERDAMRAELQKSWEELDQVWDEGKARQHEQLGAARAAEAAVPKDDDGGASPAPGSQTS